jgi:exopolysaccharide biosynthesis predicted pyruvyltransferase EpsI
MRDFLSRYSGKEILYCSNPGNGGDAFIAHATFRLFEELAIRYNVVPYDYKTEGMTIFYGGGGNLIEGRYHHAQIFLGNNVGRGNSIVLLPHTVRGHLDLLAGSSDVTVICRETFSYDALRAAGLPAERLYLSEDMAFTIDPAGLAETKKGSGTGYFFRTDAESAGKQAIPEGNLDVSMCWNGDHWVDPEFTEAVCRSIVLYLNRFETVVTDRLHVGIMGALCGKRVFLHPNDYYKNRAVYDHSLYRYPNVTFMDGGTEDLQERNVETSVKEPAAVGEAVAVSTAGSPHPVHSGLLEKLRSRLSRSIFP